MKRNHKLTEDVHGASPFVRLSLEIKVILKHLLLFIKYDFSYRLIFRYSLILSIVIMRILPNQVALYMVWIYEDM